MAEVEAAVDHLEVEVEEVVEEDHLEEDHLEVQPDQDKREEGPNWWETLLKYSIETMTGHNCSFHNGRFIGA